MQSINEMPISSISIFSKSISLKILLPHTSHQKISFHTESMHFEVRVLMYIILYITPDGGDYFYAKTLLIFEWKLIFQYYLISI